jgi:hypothetical protein
MYATLFRAQVNASPREFAAIFRFSRFDIKEFCNPYDEKLLRKVNQLIVLQANPTHVE